MKTRLYLLFLFGAMFFMACSKEIPIDELENNEEISSGTTFPPAYMVVVKFAEQEQLDYVIAQHPVKNFHTLYDNSMVYFLDTVLTLFRPVRSLDELLSWHSYNSTLADYLEKELSITGTSPYIHLTDDYYLVDWRWQDFLPLSAVINQGIREKIYNHIHKHSFITDTKWTELKTIDQYWDSTQVYPLEGVEVYSISYPFIDLFLNQYDPSRFPEPFTYYYYYGLYVSPAYGFYKKDKGMADGTRYANMPWDYQQCLSFLDSLQNSYQQSLIEIIKNNQLKEVSNVY